MSLKQKLLGFGLIAALSGCDNSNISHFTFGGKIIDIDGTNNSIGVVLENEAINSVAYVKIMRNEMPRGLIDRIDTGRLRVQDCDAEITTQDNYGTKFFHLKNCRFYW